MYLPGSVAERERVRVWACVCVCACMCVCVRVTQSEALATRFPIQTHTDKPTKTDQDTAAGPHRPTERSTGRNVADLLLGAREGGLLQLIELLRLGGVGEDAVALHVPAELCVAWVWLGGWVGRVVVLT